jgi:hypothetical protein
VIFIDFFFVFASFFDAFILASINFFIFQDRNIVRCIGCPSIRQISGQSLSPFPDRQTNLTNSSHPSFPKCTGKSPNASRNVCFCPSCERVSRLQLVKTVQTTCLSADHILDAVKKSDWALVECLLRAGAPLRSIQVRDFFLNELKSLEPRQKLLETFFDLVQTQTWLSPRDMVHEISRENGADRKMLLFNQVSFFFFLPGTLGFSLLLENNKKTNRFTKATQNPFKFSSNSAGH